MDPSIVSALSAVLGSLVGGSATIALESDGQFDQAPDVIESDPTVGVHESIVTDFHEAGR
jgi:hypothetical protein